MIVKKYVVSVLLLAAAAPLTISADEDLSVIPLQGKFNQTVINNLKYLADNDIFIVKETKCLVYEQYCNPIYSPIFKEMLQEALFNNCRECTADQKEIYNIMKPVLSQEKFKPHLKLIIDKYDPSKVDKISNSSRSQRSVENIHNISEEKCKPGHYGSPLNATCQPCACNGHGVNCDNETGKCFCTTRGVIGDHCDRCDTNRLFEGDPNNEGTCFYSLTIGYRFTFDFPEKEKHHEAINFKITQPRPNMDVNLAITCSKDARVNVTAEELGKVEKPLLMSVTCSNITWKQAFKGNDYHFGTENELPLTTLFVYVYGLHPPLELQVSVSETPSWNNHHRRRNFDKEVFSASDDSLASL